MYYFYLSHSETIDKIIDGFQNLFHVILGAKKGSLI